MVLGWLLAKKNAAPSGMGLVLVSSFDRAMDVAQEHRLGLVLSIADPELRANTRKALAKMRAPVCALDFHDIERPAPDLIEPREEHVVAALERSQQVGVGHPVLVHCHAGTSRSSALALVVAVERHRRAGLAVQSAVSAAVGAMKEAFPHVRPNMLVVDLGARALGLENTSFVEDAWSFHRGG